MEQDDNISTDENTLSNGQINDNERQYRVELRKNKIFKFVQEHPFCTIYQVSKETNTNYSEAYRTMKELVFVRLVALKMGKDRNGESRELFFVPKEEGKNYAT